ncbi:hypothetical protein LUZ60_000318 [Juncus effusus]|nr:hypothetical protein LUZ60_000318 [Juncus effusus]
MAPKTRRSPSPDPDGIFSGMVVFLVPKAVQARRLQVWRQKLIQMGAMIEETISKRVTHILAMDSTALLHQVSRDQLNGFKGRVLCFQWLENCLKAGEKLPEHQFLLNFGESKTDNKLSESLCPEPPKSTKDSDNMQQNTKRVKRSGEDEKSTSGNYREDNHVDKYSDVEKRPSPSPSVKSPTGSEDHDKAKAEAGAADHSSPYSPPDLNRNITQIFGKLINIYRALGDDRRSFSYYKAIPVIEKLPFKIESVDQVKHLPAIGKSLQDHIDEIINTGKLSKLEHFENDEKVKTVSLFGEVWGIGPATALKLYEKGHRTLFDLKNDDSLTHAQTIGLKYFHDIQQRIPRHEVKEMEKLLQDVGESILPGVMIVCGGSYRRGKSSCGDMDIVITHPDGVSHIGFLLRFVQSLKDINFLREDLIFSVHSIEGTDSGVDTYFGLCTYPGRELRHRIDLKVYPRERYAFGLIAWTGNDVLNRRLRLLAESKGYRLDDTGLYLATPGSSANRGFKSGKMVHCDTEKDVFDVLGFPYLQPQERNL